MEGDGLTDVRWWSREDMDTSRDVRDMSRDIKRWHARHGFTDVRWWSKGCFKRRHGHFKRWQRYAKRHQEMTCTTVNLRDRNVAFWCSRSDQSVVAFESSLTLPASPSKPSPTYLQAILRLDKSTSTYPWLIFNVLISRFRLIRYLTSRSNSRRD